MTRKEIVLARIARYEAESAPLREIEERRGYVTGGEAIALNWLIDELNDLYRELLTL